MHRKVIVEQDQQFTESDANNFGTFPQLGQDLLVRSAIEPGLKYWGFNVVATGVATVTVGTGAVLSEGKYFVRDDEGGVEIDLLSSLPAVANKYALIVAWGQEIDTSVEPRTFLIDAVSETTEARAVPTERIRYANVDKQVGAESTSPTLPLVNAGVVVLAEVLLSPAGIVSITQRLDTRLISSRDNADAIAAINLWRTQVGAKLDTIQTDITGLADRIGRSNFSPAFLLEMAGDVARLKETAGLPDTYSSYGFDPFLVLDQSDTDAEEVTGTTTNPLQNCLVEEGIRFAPNTIHEAQLALLNADEARVQKQDNFLIPAFTEVARIRSVGKDDEASLAQYENQTISLVQKTVSRQRVRYGSTRTVCTNGSWWKSGKYNPATGIFMLQGETFQAVQDRNPAYKHVHYRVTQFWVDSYTEPYWDQIVTSTSVNGSVIGQTFLNSQEGWFTAVGLYFSRKASTGNVTVALCECNEAGSPDPEKVVATVTLAAADIKLYPLETKVPIPLTLGERGKRYGIVLVSTGAHFVALTTGNKYNQGTLFYSTDGSWFQAGDLYKDMAVTIYSASFNSPHVEVQLQSLECAGGILDIDILSDAIVPDGTSLTYEVRIGNVWTALSGANLDALTALPPLLQLRAVFQGTTDLMPRLGVAGRSRVLTSNPKTVFTHVSTAFTPPAPVDTVWIDVRLEAWDAAHHTAVVKLLSGAGYATETTAAVIEDTPDPEDEAVIVRRYIFTYGTPISSFKVRTDGTTDSVLLTYHVAWRRFVALNA